MTPGPGIARTALPKGFTAAAINSGVRKYRPDLGMLISDRDCVAAGVFTQNECKGAPVLYSQGILPSPHVRAIVTNSGQANTATGAQGREDNWKMAARRGSCRRSEASADFDRLHGRHRCRARHREDRGRYADAPGSRNPHG